MVAVGLDGPRAHLTALGGRDSLLSEVSLVGYAETKMIDSHMLALLVKGWIRRALALSAGMLCQFLLAPVALDTCIQLDIASPPTKCKLVPHFNTAFRQNSLQILTKSEGNLLCGREPCKT